MLLSELLLKVKAKVVGVPDLREITLPGFLLLLLKFTFNLKCLPERDVPAVNKRKNGENEATCCQAGEPFSRFAYSFLLARNTMQYVIALEYSIGRIQTQWWYFRMLDKWIGRCSTVRRYTITTHILKWKLVSKML